MVWGVFTNKHVDANFRTVDLMFFSSCRTSDWQIAVLKAFSVFDNISVKSRSLQIKLIPNVISNMLIILALKMRWKTVLNNAETNIFRWDMLF